MACFLCAAYNLFIVAPYFFPFPSGATFPYSFDFNPASIVRKIEPLRASLELKESLILEEESKNVQIFWTMRSLRNPSKLQTNRIKFILYSNPKDWPILSKERIAKALQWPLKFYFHKLIQCPVNYWSIDFDINMVDVFNIAMRKEFYLKALRLEIRSVTLDVGSNFPEGIRVEFL